MVAACALCIQCRMLPSTLAAYGPAYDCMCFGHPRILIILHSSHNSRLGPASELPEGMLSMSWRMPVSWLFSSSVPWAIPGVLGSWSVLSSLCFLVLFPSRVCKHAFCFKFLEFSRARLSFSVHYRFTAGQASTGGTLWSAFVVRKQRNWTKMSLAEAYWYQLAFLPSLNVAILQGHLTFLLRALRGSSPTIPQSKARQKVHGFSGSHLFQQNDSREGITTWICPSLHAEICLLLLAIQGFTELSLWAYTANC